jgi:cytochrome oxidase Cu insertion factor (SCO1/SenC/PrrC family)
MRPARWNDEDMAMRGSFLVGALAAGLTALPCAASPHDAHKPVAEQGTSYAFPIARPGSYRLPPIKRAGGGAVLDENGRQHDLAGLLGGRTTVLSFIYTRCGDVCPTATLNMSLLQDLTARDADLSRRLRLISMSFDPDYDRPEIMHDYAAQWRSQDKAAPEWLFLTAPDRTTLAPVLAGYNQAIGRNPASNSGGPAFNHIFRAFLVDRNGRMRNIYSLDFFDPKLVINDVRTLLLEEAAETGPAAHSHK